MSGGGPRGSLEWSLGPTWEVNMLIFCCFLLCFREVGGSYFFCLLSDVIFDLSSRKHTSKFLMMLGGQHVHIILALVWVAYMHLFCMCVVFIYLFETWKGERVHGAKPMTLKQL